MRRLSWCGVLAALLIGATATAAGPLRPAKPPPLPFLPTLPRIRIDAARDHVTVVEELDVPRGEWQSGDLDLYVAFGAPGSPKAFDARLFAALPPTFDPGPDELGEPIAVDAAPTRPARAFALLGRAQMAGVVVHLKEAAFRRALGPGGVARIRLRSLYDLPPEDARTGREVVLRLGSEEGAPIAMGALVVHSLEARPWITRAGAHLCGPEADPYPLSVVLEPPSRDPAPALSPGPAAPVLAVRHASDDLCVRFWSS